MGVDKGGGTDTRPDNVDAPTSRDNSPATPPNDSSSPRRPSRQESRTASGQEGNGSPPAEGTGSGGQAEGQRDSRPGSPQAAGAGKAEAAGKAENGQGGQRDQEPRSRDTGAGSGGAASGGSDRSQGPPSERDTDARAEPTDRSPSPGRQYKLPDDNPGQPTQPSRLDSQARSRELQQQRATQNAEGTGSGRPPDETRDGRSAPPQEGNRADTAQPPGRTDTGGTGRDAQGEGHGEREAAEGEGVRQDGRPPEAPPADTRSASGGASGGEAPGEHHRPTAQPSGEQTGGPASETARPQSPEHPPLPRQDNVAAPSDSGTPPGTDQNPQGAGEPGTDEQGADERNADGQDANGQGDSRLRPEPPAETGDRTNDPAPTPPDSTHGTPNPADRDPRPVQETGTNPQTPDGPTDNDRTAPPEAPQPAESGKSGMEQTAHRPQDRPATEQPGEAATGIPDGGTTDDPPAVPREGEATQPGAETREAAAVGTAPDSGTDDQRAADDAPPPPEEADQDAGGPEPPGEPGGDHGKKGPENSSEQNPDETNQTNPEVPEPADGSTSSDRESPQSAENKNPGREVAPQGEAPVETEPSRFSGKVMITVDSDGRPIPPDREPVESEVGTRGRGEFGSPEDDPVDRDPREEDSERPSRRREVYRGIVDKPSDAKKSMDMFAEPAQRGVERVPPTGQHTGSRGNIDQFRSPDHAAKAGDAALGVAGVAIVAYETTRRSVNWIRQKLGRDRGDNR